MIKEISKKITTHTILDSILNNKKFLVRVPTIALMSAEELKIIGMSNYDNINIKDINISTEFKKRKLKKQRVKRDTAFDEVIVDSNGDTIGTMSNTELKHFINKKTTKKITKKDKMLADKTELYLTISKLIEISKEGFTIILLNNEDLKEMYTIINDTLDHIENSLNIRASLLEQDLKNFLEELTKLNEIKLNIDMKRKDSNIMEDMFGTDIFITSPSPVNKKFNMKNIKVT